MSQDAEQIKPKLEALKTIVNEVTTELYKNASPPPGDQTGEQQTGEQQSYANEEQSDSNSEKKSENTSN